MSERKVINKYYPPDFDPLKIKSGKVNKKKKKDTSNASLQPVRLMAPFSMRCLSCGEYIAKSRKFNARKQDTQQKYLQQKIFRFHIRCPCCNSEIVFRTDPKTTDFVMELGGERNYHSTNTNSNSTTTGQKLENYDEILERLEQEEQKEKEELLDKEKLNKMSKMTKIQELEEKLIAQENEEKLNDELNRLIKRNNNEVKYIAEDNAVEEEDEDEEELDKLVREEFAKNAEKQNQQFTAIVDDDESGIVNLAAVESAMIPKTTSNGLVGYDSSSDDDDEEEENEEESTRQVQTKKNVIKLSTKNMMRL